MPSKKATGRRRSEEARNAILNAARKLVLKSGFAALSMEGIAAQAGVGKQTIYRWWPSKGAVVFDALLNESDGDAGGALPDTGDFARDLRTMLRATVDALSEPSRDALFRALAADAQSDPGMAQEMFNRLIGPQQEATRTWLKRARTAGHLRTGVDLDVAVELVFGPVFRRWFLKTGALDRKFADRVTELVAHAVQR